MTLDSEPLRGLRALSAVERLTLVQDLWDSVIAEADALAVTDEERAWIDQRVAYANWPDAQRFSWEQVAAGIRAGRRMS